MAEQGLQCISRSAAGADPGYVERGAVAGGLGEFGCTKCVLTHFSHLFQIKFMLNSSVQNKQIFICPSIVNLNYHRPTIVWV